MRRKLRDRFISTRAWPLLALVSLTCGGPKDGDSGHKGSGKVDLAASQSPLINPARGPDGRGPISSFSHFRSNTAGQEDAYITSGTIEASSDVVDGKYTYNIPIKLPEGPAGLKPELALAYSSGGGNGPVGVGWSIVGSSAITRCTHNVARDGFAAGFDFNADHMTGMNQYCLDGNKLIPISRTDTRVVFQTENANFAQITGHFTYLGRGDPTYFRVDGKDGRYYTYGQGPDEGSEPSNARAAAPPGGVTSFPGGDFFVYAWHLSQVADRHASNIIRYFYEADQGSDYARANTPTDWRILGATRYLSAIRYGNTSVRLVYQDRPDPIEAFTFGFDLSVKKRLWRIEINTWPEGPVATWRYFLSYGQSPFTQRSQLTSIKATNLFNTSLPETTFKWNAPNTGRVGYSASDFAIASYEAGVGVLSHEASNLMLADVNGDGRDDVIYSIANNWPSATPFPDTTQAVVRISTHAGLGPPIPFERTPYELANPNPNAPSSDTRSISLAGAVAADLDGDGAAELITMNLPYEPLWECSGDGSCTVSEGPNRLAAPDNSVWRWDGSRLKEIAWKTHWGFYPYPNGHYPVPEQNSGLNAVLARAEWRREYIRLREAVAPKSLHIADFNGDGIPDLAGGSMDSTNRVSPQAIFLGKKSDANHPLNFSLTPISGPPQDGLNSSGHWVTLNRDKSVFYGDADGDGRADILRVDRDRKGMVFADVNGDGIPDQLDFQAMNGDADCGGRRIRFQVKSNTGKIGTWLNPAVPTFFNVDQTIVLPDAGVGPCVTMAAQTASFPQYPGGVPLDVDYAGSVRIGDFNGDGLQDLLLLNVGLDGGVAVTGGEPIDGWDASVTECPPDGCQSNPDYDRVDAYIQPMIKAHYTAPVVLMSTGTSTGAGYVPVVLPVNGARLREERYSFRKKYDADGDLEYTLVSTSGWDSHYWSRTAVGDIDGDGLTDVVQFVRAPSGAIRLETIVARKWEDGVQHRNDVIVAVTDGLNRRPANGADFSERVSYAILPILSAQERYARPRCSVSDPLGTACLTRGLMVDTFTPSGRNAGWIQYDYQSGRVDRKGRGALGFDVVTARDNLLGTQTVTSRTLVVDTRVLPPDEFGLTAYAASALTLSSDEHFPRYLLWNTGLEDTGTGPLLQRRLYWPLYVQTETTQTEFLRLGGQYLQGMRPLRRVTRLTTNDLATNIANGSSYNAVDSFLIRRRLGDSLEEDIPQAVSAWDTAPGVMSKYSSYDYDSYGNMKYAQIWSVGTIGGNFLETVRTTFDNDTNAWMLGKARHVEHERQSGTEVLTRTTDYRYWASGDLREEIVEPNGPPDLKRTTTYDYDANGAIRAIGVTGVDAATSVEPRTRSTRFVFDAAGIYPREIYNSLGHRTTITYDPAFGVPISVVDANGVGTDYVYDGFARPRGTFPDAAPATYTTVPTHTGEADVAFRLSRWVSFGAPSGGLCSNAPPSASLIINNRCFAEVEQSVVDLKSNTTQSSTRTLDGAWWDATFVYDGRSQLISHTAPVARGTALPPATVIAFDGLGRPVLVTNPDQSQRSWRYPGRFKTIATGEQNADGRKSEVTTTVDVLDRVVRTEERVANPSGSGTHLIRNQFTYHPFGGLRSTVTTDGAAATRTTSIDYDLLGRQTSTTTPTAGVMTFTYNAFGEVRLETDGLGTRVLIHDDLGRLLRRAEATNPSGRYDAYGWDSAPGSGIGRLASTSSLPDNVNQAFQYTPLGQVNALIVTMPGGATYELNHLYDSEGRVSETYYPGPAIDHFKRLKLRNSYDGWGRLTKVEAFRPTAVTLWTLNSATPLRTFETFGDGSTEERLLDVATRRLSDINIEAPSANRNLHYTYHPDGNLATATRNNNLPEGFDYDELKRLTKWTRPNSVIAGGIRREYSYNDFGDLTGTKTFDAVTGGTQTGSETYSFGVTSPRSIPSAVSGDGINTYTYDTLGRRQTKTIPGSAGPETTIYNRWNLPATIGSPAGTMAVSYDAFGKRAVKTFNGATTYYLGDAFEDRVSVDGTHTFAIHVKAGGRSIAEVKQISTSGSGTITPRYVHQDRLGSTVLLSTEASATPFYYEPFGTRIGVNGTTPVAGDPLAHHDFTGHERDDFGLINMRGRIYDPSLRRFISPDPILSRPGRSQSYNPYSYVRNNPSNMIDPSGYDPPVDRPGNGLCIGPFCLTVNIDLTGGTGGGGGGGGGDGDGSGGGGDGNEISPPAPRPVCPNPQSNPALEDPASRSPAGGGGSPNAHVVRKARDWSSPGALRPIAKLPVPVKFGPAADRDQATPFIPPAAPAEVVADKLAPKHRGEAPFPGPRGDAFKLGAPPPPRPFDVKPFVMAGLELKLPSFFHPVFWEQVVIYDASGFHEAHGFGLHVGVPPLGGIATASLSGGLQTGELHIGPGALGAFTERGASGLYIAVGDGAFVGAGISFEGIDFSHPYEEKEMWLPDFQPRSEWDGNYQLGMGFDLMPAF